LNIYIIGCLFAIISAALWAFGAILFRKLGDNISPAGLNFAKSIIATLCLGGLLLGIKTGPVSAQAYLYLGLSGLLGVSLGDTFYFRSLIELGPRLSLTLVVFIPATTVLLALVILNEQLTLSSFLGIILTLSGVFVVLRGQHSHVNSQIRDLRKGIQYGILSIVTCSLSIILTKLVIESTSAIEATFIRQYSGTIGLIVWGLFSSKLKKWIKPFADPILLKNLIFAAFISTFLGTIFSIAALKYTYASIATTLNAMSPLFILPLSYYLLKEKITLCAVLGAFIAVLGAGLIILGN